MNRILVVDDDPVNLDIVAATFEDSELELELVGGGEPALQILADDTRHIDLVILDRMMPLIDGMEVLRRIKASPRTATLPVIMQTAAAAPKQVEEGLRAGAYYYLTKPYDPAALRTIVEAALEDGQRRRQLEGGQLEQLRGLTALQSGHFSLRTLQEADALAELLSLMCPEPATAWTGLKELLTNAVEHGNLGVSYEQKKELKRQGTWREELERRARVPEYRERSVRVHFERRAGELRFVIEDEGAGFCWQRYLEFDALRAFDPNGRGIALARALCFHDLRYEGVGNVAVASIALPASASLSPAG